MVDFRGGGAEAAHQSESCNLTTERNFRKKREGEGDGGREGGRERRDFHPGFRFMRVAAGGHGGSVVVSRRPRGGPALVSSWSAKHKGWQFARNSGSLHTYVTYAKGLGCVYLPE